MSKHDGKRELVHKFLGFSVYWHLRGSIRPQGTKCCIFAGGPEQQLSDRHSDAFCYSFSFSIKISGTQSKELWKFLSDGTCKRIIGLSLIGIFLALFL